jgi:predicted deacylase
VSVGDTSLPITVLHGREPGPVLALTAGIHGYEYPPIIAARKVAIAVKPANLSGTLVIVHVANPPAFYGRSLFRNPADGKNLNRVFPGRPDGTSSERIAHFITTAIIERSDYLLDLHAGDGNEALWPHVYQPVVGDPALDKRTEAIARATGFEHIILYRDRPKDPANSISCPNTAITRGKPALTIESGGQGQVEEAAVAKVVSAVDGVMRELGMTSGQKGRRDHRVTVHPKVHYVSSPFTGIFDRIVELGQRVAQGALLGRVSDLLGNPLGEIRAPASGTVLVVIATPPVKEGEDAVTIGADPR